MTDAQQDLLAHALSTLRAGQPRDAIPLLTTHLSSCPDHYQAWLSLAEAAALIDAHDLRRFATEQGVKLRPHEAEAWALYATALSHLRLNDQALLAWQQATTLDPKLVTAWINRGVVAKRLGKFDEADRAIHQACSLANLSLATDIPENQLMPLHWHLALTELQHGDYTRGFFHFRARFYGGTDWKRITTDKPLWRGEDIAGKTLFLTAEQGHGDTLMMARYLPLLQQRGVRVILAVQPALLRYFSDGGIADQVVSLGETITEPFDVHAALFDLPDCLGSTLDTLPAQTAYLPSPARLPTSPIPTTSLLKIGIVWRGNPQHANDTQRSLSLQTLLPLLSRKDCVFFSLNREQDTGDSECLAAHQVTDLAPLLHDFSVTAALIAELDLVITCDTATAHLAAGLGKPTWIMLPVNSDWRWLIERNDSPWYPSATLFRCWPDETWDIVVARVNDRLDHP